MVLMFSQDQYKLQRMFLHETHRRRQLLDIAQEGLASALIAKHLLYWPKSRIVWRGTWSAAKCGGETPSVSSLRSPSSSPAHHSCGIP
jgi:hypothetical protein